MVVQGYGVCLGSSVAPYVENLPSRGGHESCVTTHVTQGMDEYDHLRVDVYDHDQADPGQARPLIAQPSWM